MAASRGWKQTLITWLEEHREWVILFFCLPASFIFNLTLSVWIRIRNFLYSAPQLHDDRVAKIQNQVKVWADLPEDKKRLLCTARPNWLSLSVSFFRKDLCHKVRIPLYDILELDEENLTVRVEPMVTVGDITKFLIPRGYTLAVTLEIADATLGGLAMGTGMTTYSHKVGLYHETITSFEVVLGDGRLIRTTKDNEYSDLHNALPWSHGSIAFLVGLTLQIIKVKPFVRLRYIPVSGQKEYSDKARELAGATGATDVPDYLEVTIFKKDQAVITAGDFTDVADNPEIPINNITSWYKPWWYKYVETFSNKQEEHVELVPLREYLLRHNRAIFWVVESMLPNGNNPIFRLLFGWLLPPKPAFLKLTTTPGIRAYTFVKQVFQDIVLPMNTLERQIDISEELFDTYPLLVYPCRVYDHGERSGQLKRPRQEDLVPGTNFAMYNDLGIYGVPGPVKRKEGYDAVSAMRKMEKFTRDVNGFSFLYADIFMTREEFEEMFDLTLYEEVRMKYSAVGSFPHLYDKVKPEIDVFAIGKQYAEEQIEKDKNQ